MRRSSLLRSFATSSFVLLAGLGVGLWLAIRATVAPHRVGALTLVAAMGLGVVYISLFRLVSAASARLRRQADENRFLATHDPLTGLPNRGLLLEQIVGWLPDEEGRTVWLGLVNLVRFRDVNDVLGHAHGDEVLTEVARRIAGITSENAGVARLGADEFAVVWRSDPDLDHSSEARALLTELFAKPFDVGGVSVLLRAVVGLATSRGDATTVERLGASVIAERLLRQADVALEAAQRTRQAVCRYSSDLEHANPERLALAADVDRAMAADEFMLVYQPKISMRDLRVKGVEALVRWQHPTRGLVSPAEFLPIIEQTDLMGALTDRLLDAALNQWREWWDAGIDLPVAVNLSARNVVDADLPTRVAKCLARHGAPAEALELELTESAVLEDPDRARGILEELRSLGVRLAVDDFGTGYASLAYLTALPIDTVKIDQSFARPVLTDPRSAAIVRFTVDLARHLELTVVAEGIEDAETFAALAELGCDVGQGYWMCRPKPGPDLTEWLATSGYGIVRRRQASR